MNYSTLQNGEIPDGDLNLSLLDPEALTVLVSTLHTWVTSIQLEGRFNHRWMQELGKLTKERTIFWIKWVLFWRPPNPPNSGRCSCSLPPGEQQRRQVPGTEQLPASLAALPPSWKESRSRRDLPNCCKDWHTPRCDWVLAGQLPGSVYHGPVQRNSVKHFA